MRVFPIILLGTGDYMSISLNDLKVGNLYRWAPTAGDVRTYVAFFNVIDLDRSSKRPEANTIMMYLGTDKTSRITGYMFLVGDQKFAVYNDGFRHGLRVV